MAGCGAVADPAKENEPTSSDILEMRFWLSECNRNHAHFCEETNDLSHPSTAEWLVDVEDGCVVPAKSHHYVALSYIWGNVTAFQLTLSNLESFQKPGALLTESSMPDAVPRTIRDAMKLVERLGYRYLWVDRLCIVQDDRLSKHSQILRMADTYEAADLTLIAAGEYPQADAESGLHPPSATGGRWTDLSPKRSIWYERGWTFQELYFSRRKIKFQNGRFMWECRNSTWYQSTGISGALPDSLLFPGQAKIEPEQQDRALARITPWDIFTGLKPTTLNQYSTIVKQYSQRELSHPDDGMAAFSGVTTRLTGSFNGGFLWGLPVRIFDIALLWQTSASVVGRRNGRITGRRDSGNTVLPSWSWVGWQGDINTHVWARMDYDYGSRGFKDDPNLGTNLIKPLCKWNFDDAGDRISVQTRYGALQRTPRIPYDPSPLLHTRAKSAHFHLLERLNRPFLIHKHGTLDTTFGIGWPVGIMTDPPSSLLVPSAVYEYLMIAVSRGRANHEDYPGWELISQSDDFYFEYVNVLWVEKNEQGEYFRKGLGMIWEVAWREAHPKLVDITLK